jgi:radical SAM protein with 4Fe4S-binding SPASM domain
VKNYKTLSKFGYERRLYGRFRAASRKYSAVNDMAALPFPRSIQLQTINACQAACQMCPYPIFRNVFPRGRMEDALFDKLIAEIAQHPEVDTFIPMLQNEPFIDPHLFDKIRRFKDLSRGRIAVELVTNGAYLTDDNIEQIRRSGLDILDISLDALSREVYRKVRIGLDYDEVLAGVERVIAADLPNTAIFVRIIRLRDNIHEVNAFIRHWRRRGVSVFVYTANNRTGAVEEFDAKMRLPEADQPWTYRLRRRVSRSYMGHCPVPFATTNILHNGDVLMCVHDWGRREIVGNVRDATVAEIWNGERMREVRRLVSQRRYEESPACRDCSLWKEGWF